MWAKILGCAVLAAGATLATVAVARGPAKSNCCYPGSPCCYPGSACCDDAKASGCCYPGAACCEAGLPCCADQSCCTSGGCCAGK
ncbi:MAG: hypothetical protein U0746_16165 [Gemmataceae bacterium]